ncbi:hypothetical protein HBB16_04440 [Pseudonocardia sp. MCCB 268]|nr:hypothetical protein [Pseudonocardia cytotoxica]
MSETQRQAAQDNADAARARSRRPSRTGPVGSRTPTEPWPARGLTPRRRRRTPRSRCRAPCRHCRTPGRRRGDGGSCAAAASSKFAEAMAC